MFKSYCELDDARTNFILSCTKEYEDNFEYMGLNLRAAFIRYMYFKLISLESNWVEKTIQSQGSCKEKILSMQQINRGLKARAMSIPGVRYLKNELEWLTQRNKKNSKDLPLIAVHHWKFVNYLKRSKIFDALEPAWLVNCPSMISDLGLNTSDTVVPLRIGFKASRGQYPFNELFTMARELETTVLHARPSAIFTVEGDAPYHALLAEIGKKYNIPVYCFQWGIFHKNKLKTAFSGMRFSKFLSWGKVFEDQMSEFNPELDFFSFGHLSLNEGKRDGEKIIFLSQGVDENITQRDFDLFLALAISIAKKFPNRVMWRPHPNISLDNVELENLRASEVDVLDPRAPLQEQLQSSVVAVGITSSSLVDALASGVIPISFNTTCLTDYPAPLLELNIGLEYRDFDTAVREISCLLNDNAAMQIFQSNIAINRDYFFAKNDLAERINYIHSLCVSE